MEEKELYEINEEELDIEESGCEQELFTKDEIIQVIEEILPKILLDTKLLDNLELDMDEFKRGIKETSYMCGQFVALMNVGMDKDQSYNIVLNESTSRANLEISKFQSNSTMITAMQNQI